MWELAIDAAPFAVRPRYDSGAQALVGSRCRRCSTTAWPSRTVCQTCGSPDVDVHQLAGVGTLTTWTRVWVPLEGIEPPYVVGQVELDGTRLFGHIRGDDLDTIVGPVAARVVVDERATPPFWFTFTRESAGTG